LVDSPNIPGMMRLRYLRVPLCPSGQLPSPTHRFHGGAV